MCPDMTTVYNFRRELIGLLEKEQKYEAISNEINLTSLLIKKLSKSYSLWNHRKYCIIEATNLESILKLDNHLYLNDLKLCEVMLSKDDRNFHVWNYRNWLIGLDKNLLNDELLFLKRKIENNCNNFSAYHFR